MNLSFQKRSRAAIVACFLGTWPAQASVGDRAALARGISLLEDDQGATRTLREQLDQTALSSGPQAAQFIIRVEQQIYSLGETFEKAFMHLGKPLYQGYKTQVCTQANDLIATSHAMLRVLKTSGGSEISTDTFESFVAELAAVKTDLRCF